jgi:hypothetical protein
MAPTITRTGNENLTNMVTTVTSIISSPKPPVMKAKRVEKEVTK